MVVIVTPDEERERERESDPLFFSFVYALNATYR